MHVRFAPIDENFIKSQIEQGYYRNETELVRDAVRKMREETEKANRFRNAVLEGAEAIAKGETTPYSSELIETIKQNARTKAQKSESYNSLDAIPEHPQS